MKTALINATVIGSGGFLGAMARYGLSGLVHRKMPMTTFPFGTLGVNLLGCFLIGISVGFLESRQLFGPEFRMFVLIGLLGGFTTFSAFGYETFVMLKDDKYIQAVANTGLHIFLGLALVWIGYVLTLRR